MKRSLSFHSCSLSIAFHEKDTKMECNSLIYVYRNNKHVMYKICETQGNILICRQQGYYPVVYKETPEISWETVGVYKEGGLSDDNVCLLYTSPSPRDS